MMMIQKWLLQPWATWLLSLVLATTVWGYLYYEGTYWDSFAVRLKLEGLHELGIEPTRLIDAEGKQVGDQIQIVVKGPKGKVLSLQRSEVQCNYRIEQVTSSPYLIDVTRRNFINLPDEISVEDVKLTLFYDRLVEMEARLVSRPPVGEPNPDFEFEGLELAPKTIRVRVPESAVAKVKEAGISLQSPDMSERAMSFLAEVKPVAPFKVVLIDRVSLRVLMRLRRVSKTLESIPIMVMSSPQRGSVEFVGGRKFCSITVQGKPTAIARVTDGSVRAYVYVDREPTEGGTPFTQPVEVDIRQLEEQGGNVSVVNVTPDKVDMRIHLPK